MTKEIKSKKPLSLAELDLKAREKEETRTRNANSLQTRNLKTIRVTLDFTQKEWATLIGTTEKTVIAYERGGQKVQLAHLQATATYLQVPIERLLVEDLREITKLALHNGKSLNKLLQEHNRLKGKNMTTRTVAITLTPANQSNIELVTAKAAAGYTTGYADPEYLEGLMRLYLPFLSSERTHRAFEIVGDSMLPVEAGDIIVGEYIEDLTQLKNGQTYIIVSKTEGIVYKRIGNFNSHDASLLLCSDNEAYKPYKIHLKDIEEIWRECASVRRQS